MVKHGSTIPNIKFPKSKTSLRFWKIDFVPSNLSFSISILPTPQKSVHFLFNKPDNFLRENEHSSPKKLKAKEDRGDELKSPYKR
jgi:hypothetical protein